MLPPSIEVAQLYKFVEKYIRESNRNRCINIIVKNLLKADQYQVPFIVFQYVFKQFTHPDLAYRYKNSYCSTDRAE